MGIEWLRGLSLRIEMRVGKMCRAMFKITMEMNGCFIDLTIKSSIDVLRDHVSNGPVNGCIIL